MVACRQEKEPDNLIPEGFKVLSIEAGTAAETRTAYADEKTFSWNAGDRISVLCNDGQRNFWETFTADASAAVSTFSATVEGNTVLGALDGTRVALYPASDGHVYDGPDAISFNIPLERDFRAASGGHRESAIPMFAWGNEEEEYAFANLTGAAKFTFSHVGCSHVKFSFLTTTACKLSGTFPLSLDSDAAKVRWSAAETQAAAERGVTYYADVERDGSVSFYVPYAAGTIWAWSHLTLEDADNEEADPLYSNTKINNIVVAKNRIAVLPTLDIDWAGEPSFPSAYGIDWRGISASSNTNDEYPAIQTLKATADEEYLYLYLEVDPSVLTKTDLYDHQFRVYVSDSNGSAAYWGSDGCTYISKDVWAVSSGNLCFLSWNPTPYESHIVESTDICYYEVRVSRTHDLTSALLGDTGSAREIGVGVIIDDLYVDAATSAWGRLNGYQPVGVIPTYGTALYPVTLPGPGIASKYGIKWSGISKSENTGSTYPAIRSMKATSDDDYLYVLLEMDPSVLTQTHTWDHKIKFCVSAAGGSTGNWGSDKYKVISTDAWGVGNGEISFAHWNSALFDQQLTAGSDAWYYEVRISRNHEKAVSLLGPAGEVGIGVAVDNNYCDIIGGVENYRNDGVSTVGVIPTYGSSMYPVTLAHGQEAPTDVTYTVQVTNDWVYENKPSFTIRAENPTASDVTANVQITIKTDQLSNATTVATISDSKTVPAGETRDIVVTTSDTVAPGFYKATVTVNGTQIRDSFVFGVSPTQIVSAPDKQSDFDSFWTTAKNQLKGISMNATLTEITSASSSKRKVYLVEMNSVPDGLSGTPVVIRGYYCEPTDGERHPVIIHFFGYDSQHPSGTLWVPSGGSSGTYAEFYLSNRGQYVNNRTAAQRSDGINRDFSNIYGDWFAWHFGDKNSYYYRGAYMDCVQAVRFLATRATSDMDNVFAEGTSQGGAFTYACAALSAPEYPLRAIAPGVSFMGDFPDYFQIVSWPGNTAKANKGTMTDAQMYAFLSYFDMKNLATYITCPVIACSSLQDRTCPPHTNLAPYNNLGSSEKVIYYNPLLGHAISNVWSSQYKAFFEDHIQ